MSLNVSSLTKYYNYSNLVNMASALHNNTNSSISGGYNKTNSYNNTLSGFSIASSFNEKYSKKLGELQNYISDSKEFYSDFVDNFSELKKSSNALKAYSSTSVFKTENYGSSNANVVSVTKASTNENSDYKVEVSQIATGKSVSYNEISSTGNELVTYGNISINNGQNSYDFSVDTENASNNKDAINKIADKVNKASIGVKATVEEKDGKSSLKFESTTTGINSKLTVTFGSDLGSKMNIKSVQDGKSAAYKVNGVDYSSESNSINLSSTVKAALNSVGNAEISANNIDSSKIISAVKKFTNDYNKVVNFLEDNSSKSTKIEKLADSFEFTKYSSSSLSSIGIAVGSDGKLSVNENNLKNAISSNFKNVKDIIGGSLGIANQTYSKVQDSMYNSKDLYPSFQFDTGSSSIYSYKNSNVVYSQYSALFSGGVFLNSLI